MSFSCDKVDGIHETEVESSESSLQEDILYNISLNSKLT